MAASERMLASTGAKARTLATVRRFADKNICMNSDDSRSMLNTNNSINASNSKVIRNIKNVAYSKSFSQRRTPAASRPMETQGTAEDAGNSAGLPAIAAAMTSTAERRPKTVPYNLEI